MPDPDMIANRYLPDGRELIVMPLLWGQARLHVITPTPIVESMDAW